MTTSNWLETHCRTCSAGMTQYFKEAEGKETMTVFCCINHRDVAPNIIECSRYQSMSAAQESKEKRQNLQAEKHAIEQQKAALIDRILTEYPSENA